MAYEQKDGSGSLFPNDKKGNDKKKVTVLLRTFSNCLTHQETSNGFVQGLERSG